MKAAAVASSMALVVSATLACSGASEPDTEEPGTATDSAQGLAGTPGITPIVTTGTTPNSSGGAGNSSASSASSAGGSGGGGDGGTGVGGTSAATQGTTTGTGAGGGSGGSPSGGEPPSCPAPDCTAGSDAVSCCASETVPGGSFQMGRSESGGDACPSADTCPSAETPEHAASVSTFSLDVFEVTVGRFRQFLQDYDGWHPAAGSGAHPRLADSGWRSEWDAELPADRGEFEGLLGCDTEATYSQDSSEGDTLPINCVNWFEAFAFCVYSGGRLPTEAEWEYAAAGGSEERLYPWGASSPSQEQARFYPQSIDHAGSAPAGRARFGHYDMAGNVWEWGLDFMDTGWYAGEGNACHNCARLGSGMHRVLRGGAYSFEAVTLRSATRSAELPQVRQPFIGVRCAR